MAHKVYMIQYNILSIDALDMLATQFFFTFLYTPTTQNIMSKKYDRQHACLQISKAAEALAMMCTGKDDRVITHTCKGIYIGITI